MRDKLDIMDITCHWVGSCAFGLWQGSLMAGFFMFGALFVLKPYRYKR